MGARSCPGLRARAGGLGVWARLVDCANSQVALRTTGSQQRARAAGTRPALRYAPSYLEVRTYCAAFSNLGVGVSSFGRLRKSWQSGRAKEEAHGVDASTEVLSVSASTRCVHKQHGRGVLPEKHNASLADWLSGEFTICSISADVFRRADVIPVVFLYGGAGGLGKGLPGKKGTASI